MGSVFCLSISVRSEEFLRYDGIELNYGLKKKSRGIGEVSCGTVGAGDDGSELSR